MIGMDAERAHEIARFWSDVLAIKTKKIEIIFFSIKPATRRDALGYIQACGSIGFKNGKYIGPEKEYDVIQIYLREYEEIAVPKTLEDLVYQGIVLHELIHVKFPDKSEDEIKEITGEYLSGAYCFKTKCVFCEEVLPTLTELRKHLEDVHGAQP